jgi:hypothetical protein
VAVNPPCDLLGHCHMRPDYLTQVLDPVGADLSPTVPTYNDAPQFSNAIPGFECIIRKVSRASSDEVENRFGIDQPRLGEDCAMAVSAVVSARDVGTSMD